VSGNSFTQERDIVAALQLRGRDQEDLFARARQARDAALGPRAEVRSVIEYANLCDQDCRYCGMGASSPVTRYVLKNGSLRRHLDHVHGLGRRVIMVQTGEHDHDAYFDNLFGVLAAAAAAYPDVVFIFALGNLGDDKYARLRALGPHRYLLKFETSDPALYRTLKPRDTLANRLAHIARLKALGFQVSSGNITGLPGQDLASVARDLLLLAELQLPMGSTSPYIPNDLSPLASAPPADLDLVLNCMAVLRLMRPAMLIPTTSALEILRPGGQRLGLLAGANTITVHDGASDEHEGEFVIYRKDRFIPRTSLLEVAAAAGLTCSAHPLIGGPAADGS
jgi:biotin synthase